MRNEFEAGRKSLMRGPNVPKGRPGRSMGPKTFDM
jgi:hypothetical protein